MTDKEKKGNATTGMAVDASGNTAYDPSANVLALVESSIKRLDDIAELRSSYEEKISSAELKRIDEVGKLREAYTEKLAVAESKRNDANRAFDLANVSIASERATQQAVVLTNQVTGTAETLRTLTAASDQRIATLIQNLENKLGERIMALEKTSNVGAGKSTVSDPMLSELVAEMRSLRESRDTSSGKSTGAIALWSYVAAGIGILGMITGLMLTIYHVMK